MSSSIFPAAVQPLLQAFWPHDIRAVGGYTRAYVRAEPTEHTDLDLAIALPPAQLKTILAQHPFHVDESGAAWGSFRLSGGPLAPGVSYEVTCLRQDTYVPGSRYPQVTFGVDWPTDAQRRDFTINAIYLNAQGHLLDPTGGLAHLTAGVVQFIQPPMASLSQDPLRWLRFWRFCAQYGLAGYTPPVHQALHQALPALATLSRHRVTHEVTRLLTQPQAQAVLQVWHQHQWLDVVASRLENPALLGQTETLRSA